ncbi:MAG TPA: hypothetical protein VF446_02460 [Trinickia sp.]|mgnify:CR=1 FL=1
MVIIAIESIKWKFATTITVAITISATEAMLTNATLPTFILDGKIR